MANKKNNKQFKNTESKMIQAALNIMESVSYEKITVLKVCQQANVNRSTFYAHFIDINDFMSKIELTLRLELEDFYKKDSIMESGVVPFSAESFLVFLRYIHSRKNIYKVFLSSGQQFPVNKYRIYWDRIFNSFDQKISSKEEMMYYLTGFQGSFTMIIKKWLEDDCKESEEYIAKIIAGCVPEIWRQLKEHCFCE